MISKISHDKRELSEELCNSVNEEICRGFITILLRCSEAAGQITIRYTTVIMYFIRK